MFSHSARTPQFIRKSLDPAKNERIRYSNVVKLNLLTRVSITVVASEALGTCERLAQGRYTAARRPGVEPATC